ncbi:MAG TPA: endo-1,4-beta-xylanase [Polyangiaceae bacterium]|nr:endo-1,4-beta-xylanase [Polyangiaceae bacterium]
MSKVRAVGSLRAAAPAFCFSAGICLVVLGVTACSSSTDDPGASGSGGSLSQSGGTSGAGGQTSTGGTAGPSSGGQMSRPPGGTGGASAVGGAAATGGLGGESAGSGGAPAAGAAGSSGSNGTSGASGSGNGGTPGAGGNGVAGSSGGSGTGGGGAAGGASASKFVGNITTSGAVRDGFAKYWNQITPENEGKWGSVQPSQGTFNWGSLDKIYAYTQSNHIAFKEHNFIWGSQQPSWVNNGNAQTAVQAWMKAFCERYPETKLIDVVNEPPPHTTPAYIDGMGGTGASGWDWIVNAFKWARAACPNAILILNDYNDIEYQSDNAHLIDIVTKLEAAGAPIDAIGAQAHDAYKIPTNTVKGFIDKLSGTGLPVYITEYDIPIADDNQQKTVMQEQMTMYFNDTDVGGITLWGYVVGATWKANTGIQQTDGTMRPAMTWLMSFLGR